MILALLSSVIFIGVTGLAIDYGNAVLLEAKLKSSSDIATLAGIQDVPYNTAVEYQMQELINENYPFAGELKMDISSDDDSCWMTTSHQVPTYFMRYFGQDTLTINARSRAILEPIDGMSGNPGISPFVIVNPNKNSFGGDDLMEANHGKPFVLKYGAHNTMIEDWYFGRQIVADGVVHDGSGAGEGLDPGFGADGEIPVDIGWRGVLGLDPDSDNPLDGTDAAVDYQQNFEDSWQGLLHVDDLVNACDGTMDQPTVKGRLNRLDGYTSTNFDEFDPNLDPTNPRIVIVPVVSLGEFDVYGDWQDAGPAEIINNQYQCEQSKIDGFAAFYLLTEDEQSALPGGDEINRKWVVGRFLYGLNIGGDINNPGGGSDPDLDLGMFQGRLVPFDQFEKASY